MKRVCQTLKWLLVSFAVAGCSSTRGYFINRCRDSADIFTLTVVGGAGAKVRFGPLQAGLCGLTDLAGLRGGEVCCFNDEPDKEACVIEGVNMECVMGPYFQESFEYVNCEYGEERHKLFKATGFFVGWPVYSSFICRRKEPDVFTHLHYATAIEAAAGAVIGVRLGLHPGELVDFVLGWTTLDIFGDDIEGLPQGEVNR